MLTPAQVEQYHEAGYVIPDFRLSDATLSRIKDAHSRLVEAHAEFTDYCPAVLPYAMEFLDFAQDEAILDMVTQLIGDNIALWNSSFFAKPALTGSRTPWHQDGEYWPMRPLATCTVWMAIDDATLENGCLEVIPGSHKDKRLRQHTTNDGPNLALNQALIPEELDSAKAAPLILEAGRISLHDVYLVHGSEPNRSSKPRRGMTLRFMPTSSYYDRSIERELYERAGKGSAVRPLFLMRGIDECGKNDYENTGSNSSHEAIRGVAAAEWRRSK
ncbi:MAG: phytanoyl-CoA dioxygenase family protein [Gammaproteobacteria bacterium]|nr:phytanoyl-CoA dioxygenase family protein [Gammaproteobacteria bacterium]